MMLLLLCGVTTLHGSVVFRAGSISPPNDHWSFGMDSWVDFGGGIATYRENPDFEFEDPGLFVLATAGELSVEEILPDRLGTSFLGDAGASYSFRAMTIIEYPATTMGLRVDGDPGAWTFRLCGYDLSGGVETFAVFDTRNLEEPGWVEWAVDNGYITTLEISNEGTERVDPLLIDSLYVGDFLGDTIPESGQILFLSLGVLLTVGRRKRNFSVTSRAGGSRLLF